MQLRQAVHRPCLHRVGCGGVREAVHRAVGGVRKPPGPAQVDDAQAALQQLRGPLAGLLVRSGEEDGIDIP